MDPEAKAPPARTICKYIPDLSLCDGIEDEAALENIKKHGEYSIKRRVGWGTFSSVYLATRRDEEHKCRRGSKQNMATLGCTKQRGDCNAPTLYAIKVVSDEDVSPSEILAGDVLDHPNIGRLIRWFAIGKHYYLVYEFVDGADLQVMWERVGPFDEGHFRGIFKQVLCALLYCHENGVSHRDIKMENIIVYGPERSHAKLVDFGFAFFSRLPDSTTDNISIVKRTKSGSCVKVPLYHRDHLNEENRLIGTEDYCAPEVALGAIDYEGDLPATDVYSLGVVLYCALVGAFPRSKSFVEFLMVSQKQFNEDMGEDADGSTRALFDDPDFCVQLLKRSSLTFDDLSWAKRNKKVDTRPKAKLSEEVKDLLMKLLHPIPCERITLADVAKHPWVKGKK